uniref:Uncharacterized protein n=1 Tax=Cucumis melo TaxID=3656 RepID=A0A9I9EAA9_CUCME
MRCIVAPEEGEEENGEIVFKNVEEIEIYALPRLACFHNGKCTIKFPSEILYTVGSCEMETFSHTILSLPKLKYIGIEKCEFQISPGQDINVIIRTRFQIILTTKSLTLSIQPTKKQEQKKFQLSQIKEVRQKAHMETNRDGEQN